MGFSDSRPLCAALPPTIFLSSLIQEIVEKTLKKHNRKKIETKEISKKFQKLAKAPVLTRHQVVDFQTQILYCRNSDFFSKIGWSSLILFHFLLRSNKKRRHSYTQNEKQSYCKSSILHDSTKITSTKICLVSVLLYTQKCCNKTDGCFEPRNQDVLLTFAPFKAICNNCSK